MKKKQIIIFLIALVVLIAAILTVIFLFKKEARQSNDTITIDSSVLETQSEEGFLITQKNIIAPEDSKKKIEQTPFVNKIFSLAQDRGFTIIEPTLESIDEIGVSTAITPLQSENGQTALFVQTTGFGSTKANFISTDLNNNALITYNDDSSGLKTNLDTGEIIEKWGEVIHHSDEYDFNVELCKANHFLWNIGLADELSQKFFEMNCGTAKPSDLLQGVFDSLDFADGIQGLLEQQIACVSWLKPIIEDGKKLAESGDISFYMADLAFGLDINDPLKGVKYIPGEDGAKSKFGVTVANIGKGYCGSYGLAMYSKKTNDSNWRLLTTVQMDSLRPRNSNGSYPRMEWDYKLFQYSPEEGEIVSFKIDPHDIIEEREEENNQVIIGRDILNQKPVAKIQLIHSNPTESGKSVIFQAQGIDYDGHIALRGYEWNFGDGTKWRTNRIINYSYYNEGNKTVTLRVQDAEGLWSDPVQAVVVVNKPLSRPNVSSDKMMSHAAFKTPSTRGDAIVLNKDGLWILENNELSKIDQNNGEKISGVTLSFLAEEGDKYMTWTPSGYFWIIEKDTKTVYQVNAKGEQQGSFQLEKEPTGITWDGNLAISISDNTVMKVKQDGSLVSLHEMPSKISYLHFDGQYYWALSMKDWKHKIVKMDNSFNILEQYPAPQEDEDCEKEQYINYPYRPTGFVKEGKFLWIIGKESPEKCWTDEKIRSAIVYKIDISDYKTPFQEPIPGQYNPMVGMVWDGDAFIIAGPATQHLGVASERIVKQNADGSYVSMKTDEIYQDDTYYSKNRDFKVIDVARDQTNLWILALDSMMKLSFEGEVLETFSFKDQGIKTMTFYDDYWWIGGGNKVYKIAQNGEIVSEYTTDYSGIVDFVWASGDLWISYGSNRIHKTSLENDKFNTTEIYLADSLYRTSGKHIGWDGQNLWYTAHGRIYRLDHIDAGWELPTFQTPIFNTESRLTSLPQVSQDVLGDVCYAVPTLPENYDGDSRYNLVRQVEAISPNEIYLTHGPIMKKFDGSKIIELGKIEAINDNKMGTLNIFDMAVSQQTGEKFIAYEDALMYHDGIQWRYVPGLGKMDPYSISATDNGAVYIAGSTKEKSVIARYQNKKATIQFEYPGERTFYPKIYMVSDSVGYAAFNNEIYSYTLGEWRKTRCELPDDVKSIYFPHPALGFIGIDEHIYKFENGRCSHEVRLPDGFTPLKLYAPSDSEVFISGDDPWAKTSFYYYDGAEVSTIWLENLVQTEYERRYDYLSDMDFIPDKGLVLSGLSANLIICPDIEKVKDHAKREIQIKEGKVVSITPRGVEREIITAKEFEKIDKFIEVHPDPYKYHLCIIGQAMIPKYVYISQADGEDSRELGSGKECVWSHDGMQFVYTDHTTDISSINIHYAKPFPITLSNLTGLANRKDNNTFRTYQTPYWSDNDDLVIADFTEFDTSQEQWSYREGTISIHMNQDGRPLTDKFKE
ncbi:PKD domain-containing protein [Candidatus Parcubacteria bacterium]|nr:PKD domain-containing protein [Candidatus Parcubacteria bacterium]